MILTNSILVDVRGALGLSTTTSDFDSELLMHINASIGVLNQNGVGREVLITDETTTWEDLQDPARSENNAHFKMAPLFVMLNTKLLFDPPPPSSVQYYQSSIDQLLWRLRVGYEEVTTTTTTHNEW